METEKLYFRDFNFDKRKFEYYKVDTDPKNCDKLGNGTIVYTKCRECKLQQYRSIIIPSPTFDVDKTILRRLTFKLVVFGRLKKMRHMKFANSSEMIDQYVTKDVADY